MNATDWESGVGVGQLFARQSLPGVETIERRGQFNGRIRCGSAP